MVQLGIEDWSRGFGGVIKGRKKSGDGIGAGMKEVSKIGLFAAASGGVTGTEYGDSVAEGPLVETGFQV